MEVRCVAIRNEVSRSHIMIWSKAINQIYWFCGRSLWPRAVESWVWIEFYQWNVSDLRRLLRHRSRQPAIECAWMPSIGSDEMWCVFCVKHRDIMFEIEVRRTGKTANFSIDAPSRVSQAAIEVVRPIRPMKSDYFHSNPNLRNTRIAQLTPTLSQVTGPCLKIKTKNSFGASNSIHQISSNRASTFLMTHRTKCHMHP